MKLEPWHINAIQTLRFFSDLEAQRHEWVDSMEDTVFFPTEAISQLFDDTAFDHYVKTGQPFFWSKCDAMMDRLGSMMAVVDFDMHPSTLMQHPDWLTIVQLAKDIVSEIESVLGEDVARE